MRSFAFIATVFLIGFAGSNYAEPAITVAPQTPAGLPQIQAHIQHANETIEQIKLKRTRLQGQLQLIEKQYGETAKSLHDLTLQIGGKQQRIKNLSKEMQKRQAQLKKESLQLSKQIKASFVMGRKEQLKLLLNQENPAVASRMMVYYNYLNQNRLAKLAKLKKNIVMLNKLEKEKRRESGLLGRAVISHQNVQVDLARTKQQRELLLAKLGEDIKRKSRRLSLLEENAAESQTLIDRLQQMALVQEKQEALKPVIHKQFSASDKVDADGNPVVLTQEETEVIVPGKPFAELKGKLAWPTPGAIVKRFGSRREETRWDGVLISAPEGADIHAVSAGQVVFADWLKGYGWLIIINHGSGYMSLYAFNQTVYKKTGEHVNAGAVIGAVGKSGGHEEAGLYFGIRMNGKAVNPAFWCKKG